MYKTKLHVFLMICKFFFRVFFWSWFKTFFLRLSIRQKFEDLPKSFKVIEKQCLELDWSSTSLAVTGTPTQLPISFYVDEISDILYQYDIALTCILQYFNVINLRDPISYENLLKSFTLSSQLIEFVDEFLLKCNSHVEWWRQNKNNRPTNWIYVLI